MFPGSKCKFGRDHRWVVGFIEPGTGVSTPPVWSSGDDVLCAVCGLIERDSDV